MSRPRFASSFRIAVMLLLAGACAAAARPAAPSRAAHPAASRSLRATFGFESSEPGDPLFVPWLRGGNARDGAIAIDTLAHLGRRSACLDMPDTTGLLSLNYVVPDSQLAGRVAVRVRVWLRTDGRARAGLWARVQGLGGAIAQRDESEHAAARPGAWTRSELLLPIAPEARRVTFGVALRGGGRAWVDDVSLELLDVTDAPRPTPAALAYVRAAFDSLDRFRPKRTEAQRLADQQRASVLLTGARTSADTYDALRDLVARHERPARFRSPREVAIDDSLAAIAIDGRDTWPRVDRFDTFCGYLQLPGCHARDLATRRAYADDAHKRIWMLDSLGVCGYVIDLRRADGTNPDALLAAVGPLLGDFGFGGEVGRDSVRVRWSYADGVLTRTKDGGRPVTALATSGFHLKHAAPAVAVLIGPGTMLAGEAVAAAFRGHADVRFFGTPTAGLARGMRDVRLRDGARLDVPVTTYFDRDGVLLTAPVLPDVKDTGEAPKPGYREPIVEAAIQWIRDQPSCR